MRRVVPFAVALGLVAGVIVPYVALGGGSFEPTPVADACAPREYPTAEGLGETMERIALTVVDNVACQLGVSREELVLALRSEAAFDTFARENHIDRAEAERAIRDGLVQAVDGAKQDGTLPSLIAPLVRKAAESVPPWLILDTLERLGSFLP